MQSSTYRFQKAVYKKPKSCPPPEENQIKIVAPYLKGTTERVTRLLKDHNIKIFSRNQNSLRSKLCKIKDKIPNLNKNLKRI